MTKKMVPVGISNRHLHLKQADIDTLFGAGYQLTNFKDLSQPGQYACAEKVDLVGPKGTIKGVRILGPARGASQVEISVTDSYKLGVPAMVRNSGDIDGTPGVTLVGPQGEVVLDKGVIIAARHIHMHTSDAEAMGFKDKDIVKVKVDGARAMVLENVLLRVHPEYALDFHIDTDEGNAAGLKNGQEVEIV